MSYYELLKNTAELLNKKIKMAQIRYTFIGLSRFWVSLFLGAPKSLVYPLLIRSKMSWWPLLTKSFRP